MNKSQGFTVFEVIVVAIVAIVAGFFIVSQRNEIESTNRDNQRKTAINAIYYSLENSYRQENTGYPLSIDDKTLKTLDPALLTDPEGNKLGTSESNYRYEPIDCNETNCKSYTLRSTMEREDDFIKTNAAK